MGRKFDKIEGWGFYAVAMGPLLIGVAHGAVTRTLQPGELALFLALFSGTSALWSILLRGLDR